MHSVDLSYQVNGIQGVDEMTYQVHAKQVAELRRANIDVAALRAAVDHWGVKKWRLAIKSVIREIESESMEIEASESKETGNASAWYHVQYRMGNSEVRTTDCMTEKGYSTVEDFPKMIALRSTGKLSDADRVQIISLHEFPF